MHTSFLYHAFGVREQACSRVRYEDKRIVLNLQTRSENYVARYVKARIIFVPEA